MKYSLKKSLQKVAIAGAILFGASAPAQSAVIELALAIDGSGSIRSSDFDLQTGAYQNIFNDDFYTNYVVGGDELWVSVFQFASGVTQDIGWMQITDNASAAAFGNMFAGISQDGGSTNTASAIMDAHNSMLSNGIDSDRQIIDISTDGSPTRCTPNCSGSSTNSAYVAAANALAGGTVTNAIGIGDRISTNVLDTLTTNGGGFYTTAANFAEFEAALATKLFREINTSVSEPGTLALFGLGLMGVAAARRKAKS